MSAVLAFDDRWGLAAASDRRFRRCCALVLPLLMTLLVLLPQGPWPQQLQEIEPLRVQILPPPPPPTPLSVPRPVERTPPVMQPKPATAKAQPQPKPVASPSARTLAEAAGMANLRSQLASLQLAEPSMATDARRPLQQEAMLVQGSAAGSADRFTASAGRGSSGIGQGERGASSAQATAALGARRTAAVHSTLAGKADAPASGDAQGRGGRSLQEIQLAFDRSKSSFFSIFNRAARERADIGAGRIVVSLTIAPDGSVMRCDLVSSSFSDGELEQKILQRVKLLNFGPKDVPAYTYPNYPIHFLPS